MSFCSIFKNLPQSQLALTLEKHLPQPARKGHLSSLPIARGVSKTMSNETRRMPIVVSIEGGRGGCIHSWLILPTVC